MKKYFSWVFLTCFLVTATHSKNSDPHKKETGEKMCKRGQKKLEKDRASIKRMSGCYEVGFNFAETFQNFPTTSYKPSKTKRVSGVEWIELLEDSENKIVLQHLIIAGEGPNAHIIKHWRQDWQYQNTDFYIYDHENKWQFQKKPKSQVRRQWTQKVFQVDDSPRYEGSGTWVHVDGKSYWENTTYAPLPRREYTARNDYNVLLRRNRHEITPEGWIHDQDNDKIKRMLGKEDLILAQEKGLNVYRKISDSKCLPAKNWWVKNKKKWALVRDHWKTIFSRSKDLELSSKVEGKMLYQYLFPLNENIESKNIKKIIDSFVK